MSDVKLLMQLTFLLVSVQFVCIAFANGFSHFIKIQELTKGRDKLVLDMDDTIYSIFSGLRDSLLGAIRQYVQERKSVSSEEANKLMVEYYLTHGLTIKGLQNDNIDVSDYEQFILERTDYKTISADENLVQMISTVNADIVIFTNSGQVHTEETLKRLGVYNLVHYIIYTDYYHGSLVVKPNPDAYLRVQTIVGEEDASKYHFVDDSIKNVEAARKLGWKALHLKEVQGDAIVPQITSEGTVSSIYDIPTKGDFAHLWE